ncbi:MAG: hypothetical protein IJ400_02650 [Clostridia bacterium]|nr:hypothetical protein [Clostridia bacterium]
MNKSINEELSRLRKLYLEELAKKEEKYRADIEEIEEKIKDAEEYDYSESYTSRYESSLGSLERIYEEIATTHSKTKGISFKVYDYITTLSPNGLGDKNVEDFFLALVKECKGAISQISKSNTPEDDIEPLKVFCQCLVDLRYIVANKEWLIKQSGIPSALKEKALEPLNDEKDARDKEYEEETKLECLDCYEELMSFKAQVEKGRAELSKRMLSNQPITPAKDYKFLMGFYKTEIESDLVKFAEDVLSLSQDQLSQEPIYFELSGEHSTILINAKKSILEDRSNYLLSDVLNNIYLSMVSNMPSMDLRFTGIECISVALRSLAQNISESSNKKAVYKEPVTGEDRSISSFFEELNKLVEGRSIKYIAKRIDIFQYNRRNPDNKDYFVFLGVNHYPYDFFRSNDQNTKKLKSLATKSGKEGIITVICQAEDGDFDDKRAPKLTKEELKADLIEIKDDDTTLYNGREATLNICTPDYSEEEYWERIKAHLTESPSLPLVDIIEKTKNDVIKPFYEEISIPIGRSEGKPYYLELKPCTATAFGLISGGVGSGKSSFLHTLILSIANRYSPDDVRLFLVDFKSERDAPEFSQYRKSKEIENLYVPHVEYLMVNGKRENAYDALDLIHAMHNKRCENFADFEVYNKSDEVKSGKKPKMPFALFIFDEANSMLMESQDSPDTELVGKLLKAIKTVRSSGIGIILCGQKLSECIGKDEVNNFQTRIALPIINIRDYNMFSSDITTSINLDSDTKFLKSKGYGVFIDSSEKNQVHQVRTAFSGKTGCSEQVKLAKEIREKWEAKCGEHAQFEGGSESFYPINEMLHYRRDEKQDSEVYLRIPIGVSYASSEPVCLEYKKDQITSCFAFANREQLFSLERNAMLSFAIGDDKPNKGSIKYFATLRDTRDCLFKYFSKAPFLKERITTYSEKADMAREISYLYQLYEERKAGYNNCKDFEPMLVVLHNMEQWLDGNDSSWFGEPSKEKELVQVMDHSDINEDLIKQAFEELEKDSGKNESKLCNEVLINNNRKQTSITELSDGKQLLCTVKDYKDAIKNIYKDGAQYGICMIIASHRKLHDFVKEHGDLGIYSSYSGMKTNVVETDAQKSCVHVHFQNRDVKVRLFDSSIENNKEWWSKLEKKLKEN